MQIRLPLPALVSILHRLSGALLFLLGIPFMLALLQGSLASEAGYARWQECLASPLSKLVILALVWALLHHLFAGVRYLAHDLHWGTTLAQARLSSKLVLAVSLVLTAGFGIWLW